jgi:hypothetical protein
MLWFSAAGLAAVLGGKPLAASSLHNCYASQGARLPN